MRKFREIKTFTLILKALLNPLAKKPPNGPMTEAKIDINNECNKNGYRVIVSFILSWKKFEK